MFGTRDYARALKPLLVQAAGYAHALLRNRADAEDAVQQAALRGLERIATFDASRPFRGWWFAFLRNCCIDILRRRPSTEPLGDHDAAAPVPDDRSDWARLDEAIEKLPPIHAEILRLRYFGDLSYADLVEALRIPQGTVMSRLHLARNALAASFKKETP
jgi:RNA polymerase sigma-70 factor (ECF subfamily)